MQRTSRWAALTLVAALAVATPAAAQDADRFSLVIGGHGQVGVLMPLTQSISLRPDLRFRRSNFSSGPLSATLTEAFVGVAMLHYLSRDERLSTYWSPRLATRFSMRDPDDDTETSYWQVSATFGVNGAVTERFGVFAEAGPQLIYTEASSAAFPPTVFSRDVALIGVFGVTFRF